MARQGSTSATPPCRRQGGKGYAPDAIRSSTAFHSPIGTARSARPNGNDGPSRRGMECMRLCRKVRRINRLWWNSRMTSRPSAVSARIASAMAPLARQLRDRDLLYWKRARVVRCDALGRDEPTATAVEAREASDEDLHLLASMQGRPGGDWLARRTRGIVCLVAWSGPAPNGYLWITRSAEEMTEVNHVLDVSRDPAGAYLFDGYVFPSHRRKGVLRE